MSRFAVTICAVSVTLVFLLSCDNEIEAVTWDRLDYTTLLEKLKNPTGELVNGSVDETMELIEETTGLSREDLASLIDDLIIVYNATETTIQALKESRGTDPPTSSALEKNNAEGSSAYLRVACKGLDSSKPSYDFSQGKIQYESSSFALEDAISKGIEKQFVGHALARFVECQMVRGLIRGDCPAYMSDERDHLALDLNLSILDKNDVETDLVYNVVLREEYVRILLDTGAEGYYMLRLYPNSRTQFDLGMADGFYGCDLALENLGCEIIS